MMRALLLAASFPPALGGVETLLYETTRRMREPPLVLAPTPAAADDVAVRRVSLGPLHRAAYRPAWGLHPSLHYAQRFLGPAQKALGAWRPEVILAGHVYLAPLARLLSLRAGVPYVVAFYHPSIRGQDKALDDTDAYGWDTHNDIFDALGNRLLPRFDATFAALLDDLAQRVDRVVARDLLGVRAALVGGDRNHERAARARRSGVGRRPVARTAGGQRQGGGREQGGRASGDAHPAHDATAGCRRSPNRDGCARPRFSRSVPPPYPVRNAPRSCRIGTTRSTNASRPKGIAAGITLKPSAAPWVNHSSIESAICSAVPASVR